MALKATIYKAVVNVADLDRNRFLDAALTLARHPSETQERMMLRLLAWIKYADERLQFTRGLSAEDEPEAWLRNDHLGIDCLLYTSPLTCPSGIWMTGSWRSSVNLPIVP